MSLDTPQKSLFASSQQRQTDASIQYNSEAVPTKIPDVPLQSTWHSTKSAENVEYVFSQRFKKPSPINGNLVRQGFSPSPLLSRSTSPPHSAWCQQNWRLQVSERSPCLHIILLSGNRDSSQNEPPSRWCESPDLGLLTLKTEYA